MVLITDTDNLPPWEEEGEQPPIPTVSFAYEARTAAVNEACGSVEEAAECNVLHLCPACNALAHAIEARLIRAFIAGQKSMQPAGD